MLSFYSPFTGKKTAEIFNSFTTNTIQLMVEEPKSSIPCHSSLHVLMQDVDIGIYNTWPSAHDLIKVIDSDFLAFQTLDERFARG